MIYHLRSAGGGLPLLAWVVLGSLLAALLWPEAEVLGFKMTGWAWLCALMVALPVLARGTRPAIRLPYGFWVPWMLVVVANLFRYHANALQASLQIIAPILVGMAASTYRPSERQLAWFIRLTKFCTVVFWGIVLYHIPMLLYGKLPEATWLAMHAITAVLLATLYLALFLHGDRRALVFLAGCLAVPIVALGRGAMLASVAVLASTFSRLSLLKRVLIIAAAAGLGLALFQMPTVQKKMFFSGAGTLSDISADNRDFATSGRFTTLWPIMIAGIQQEPWLGHGANANAERLIQAGATMYLPHNDWLRIAYDYGIPLSLFLPLAILLQMLHAFHRSRRAGPNARVLFLAGASAFIPFMLLMITDNLIVYDQFFGNVQFLWLGLAYGAGIDRGIHSHPGRARSVTNSRSRLPAV